MTFERFWGFFAKKTYKLLIFLSVLLIYFKAFHL